MNHCRRPPGLRSQLSACALKYSSRMPPWPCTMAFGMPVVPDENSTLSGWSKATGRNSSGAGLGQQLAPGHRVRDPVLAVGDVHDVAQAGEGGADRRHLRAAVDRGDRGSRSRRRSAGPPGRAARGGRRRCGRRARARSSPRPRRCSRPRRTRRASRGCSACRRRRARPAGRRAAGDPRGRARSALADPRRRAPCARASASRRPPRPPGVVVLAHEVLGEVEARAREPGGARHRVGGQDGGVGRVRLDAPEVPDRRPEALEVVDGPALQLVVTREGQPALALEPGDVATDLGRLPDVGGRRPENAGAVALGQAHRRHPRNLTLPFQQSERCLDKRTSP